MLPANATAPAKTAVRGGARPATKLGSVESCTNANAIAQNFVPNITPDAAHSGDEVTTVFDYDLTAQVVEGATATYSVSWNFIPIDPTVDSLCADQGADDPCPLAVGHHTDKSVSTFPDLSGYIVSTIEWADAAGNQILCVKWTVNA